MNNLVVALVGCCLLLVASWLALFAFFSGVSLGMHLLGSCIAGVCP